MIKKLLDFPMVYLTLQWAIGAKKARKICIERFAKPKPGERVLDVGCGPGFVIEYMPKVDYVGTDIDHRYIDYAKKKYGSRGEFHCMELTTENAHQFGQFDLVLLNGVLHHIDDAGVLALLTLLRQSLSPGGRIMTLDGCYYESMSRWSRYFLDHDRGAFVRTESAYLALARQLFKDITYEHRKDLFGIPYDALVMILKA